MIRIRNELKNIDINTTNGRKRRNKDEPRKFGGGRTRRMKKSNCTIKEHQNYKGAQQKCFLALGVGPETLQSGGRGPQGPSSTSHLLHELQLVLNKST